MHLAWLGICIGLIGLLCLAYGRCGVRGRKRLRRGVGLAVLACELAKDLCLLVQGAFGVGYLPLHLCGLAVFFTLAHAIRPGQTLGDFLYSTCMPGAAFALAFPDWTDYPPFAYHSVVAFTVHALLVAYPLMQLCGGDLRPDAARLKRCLAILLVLALPIYGFNRAFGTNYMFLCRPAPGSPLEWFASFLGNPGYLLGYIPMLALVWGVLYFPVIRNKRKKRS